VEKDAAVLEQRLSAQGALEQRRRFLTAREALLERVWEQAEAELRCITEAPEYLQTLEALAFEAGASLGVTRLELAADPRGHQLLTAPRLSSWSQEAGVMFDRAKQPLDTWGGLLARNGRLCYDATFASRLAWARKNLRERVFAQLMETR
jgi:vacuolar-type H+-ATPase subunit E/Vma4